MGAKIINTFSFVADTDPDRDAGEYSYFMVLFISYIYAPSGYGSHK